MVSNQLIAFLAIVVTLILHGNNNTVVEAQLRADFYSESCPPFHDIVQTLVSTAILAEPRMGASLLRLFYLDCFPNGCDGSILLEDTASFTGEQTAPANHNSARGFNVIENIKSEVEQECPGVVSCADILATAARDSLELLGGPSWQLYLGRRDSRTTRLSEATVLPSPFWSLKDIIPIFQAAGFNTPEMVALFGGHTIGQARCTNFRERIYNDANIDTTFATILKLICPENSGDENLASLDTLTPFVFDNSYFRNLISKRGLLHSDQELFNGDITTEVFVHEYSRNLTAFRTNFKAAMLKMSQRGVLTGSDGVIRDSCGRININ